MHGYNDLLLWVDLSAQTFAFESRPESFFREFVGGGLLGTRLLLERGKQGMDPLGPDNLLIFTSSVMAGQPTPGLARFTVCAKSPLTNGIGETRCEGPWANALKASGVDAVIFTGCGRNWTSVSIDGDKVSFLPAEHLCGKPVGAAIPC